MRCRVRGEGPRARAYSALVCHGMRLVRARRRVVPAHSDSHHDGSRRHSHTARRFLSRGTLSTRSGPSLTAISNMPSSRRAAGPSHGSVGPMNPHASPYFPTSTMLSHPSPVGGAATQFPRAFLDRRAHSLCGDIRELRSVFHSSFVHIDRMFDTRFQLLEQDVASTGDDGWFREIIFYYVLRSALSGGVSSLCLLRHAAAHSCE